MDFDGDGNHDVISGSYPGELYLFKGQGGGKFSPSEQIKHADGAPVKVGMAAVAFAHDWDADGDLDLLVGDIEGQVHLVPNDGSRTKPAYGKAAPLRAGNAPVKVAGGDAGPTVADWDADGKADLIVGNGAGGVVWYRNAGAEKTPQLAAAQALVPDVMNVHGGEDAGGDAKADANAAGPKRGTRAKVHAADWDGDGKLDLLVGDFVYEQAQEPAQTPEQQAARKEKRDAWMKEYQALQTVPVNESSDARRERMKRMGDLIARFRETQAQEAAAAREAAPSRYHGYVWVYLREGAVAKAL